MKTIFFRNIKIVTALCATFVETRHATLLTALLFLFPLLGRGLGGGLWAQSNGVTVTNLEVSAGTVTFDVSWKNTDMPSVWSDSVWVFVDYNNAGKMERLLFLPGATLTATSAPDVGKVIEEPGNNKGVWVVGNAKDPTNSSGSFYAKVKLFTSQQNIAGACAYASNYPPVGEYLSAMHLSFIGTPPYSDIVLKDSSGGMISQSSTTGDYYMPESYIAVVSFTDKTGAPGIIHCLKPDPPTVVDATFCFGLPGQLQASASGNATIAWYDALTAGNLLYAGNVLSLKPLYDNTAQYYAEAVSALESSCVSVRTQAHYTVNNCVIAGECPNFTAGAVGSGTRPAACSSFYPGRINATDYPAACVSFDAGHIGRSQ